MRRPSYGYEGCTLWSLLWVAFVGVFLLVGWLFGPRVAETALKVFVPCMVVALWGYWWWRRRR